MKCGRDRMYNSNGCGERLVTMIDDILTLLRRLVAEQADREPATIRDGSALKSVLTTDEAWVGLQRGIFINFNCFLPLDEIRAQRSLKQLARTVKNRIDQAAPLVVPKSAGDDHLRQEEGEGVPYQTVRVFYATDRAGLAKKGPVPDYSPRRGRNTLTLGVAEVAIPRTHKFGQLERPPWWHFFRSPDPRRHITVLGGAELSADAFWNNVRSCVASSQDSDILVLIHGFNVSFEQGLCRAAQIVADINFHGAPILYSWPSKGSVDAYSADEASVEWTVPRLKGLLRGLLENAGAAKVHVIAHSMGNRAAVAAIRELDLEILAPHAARMSQFVLAAPDIDADTFRQFANEFAGKAQRCTLYANSEDRALAASGWKHGGYPRAGGGGEDLVIVPHVDTIDATGHATDFLSHSYFAAASPVVTDLFGVLRGTAAQDRPRMKRCTRNRMAYWQIAP